MERGQKAVSEAKELLEKVKSGEENIKALKNLKYKRQRINSGKDYDASHLHLNRPLVSFAYSRNVKRNFCSAL